MHLKRFHLTGNTAKFRDAQIDGGAFSISEGQEWVLKDE